MRHYPRPSGFGTSSASVQDCGFLFIGDDRESGDRGECGDLVRAGEIVRVYCDHTAGRWLTRGDRLMPTFSH